ncbi:hypothetical protein [Streptomyces sp. NBC_00094]|uniref:hypothetical protein n=1 Tax=Streptomyces sp. NBC_00094 TaxID=2903620 RepID=UPI0022538350|nr:hypothetical protein [Streptomyces sp. NBC_00094]MCX5394199.1 hypothetical protein [Streptomyces sp. NBC_00094]
MARLRLAVADWPRRSLVLTDTPRPNCPECDGEGGWNCDYGDYETGEYAGTDWDPCHCWDEDRCWTLLPLPRRRTAWADPTADPWAPPGGHSDEPPF